MALLRRCCSSRSTTGRSGAQRARRAVRQHPGHAPRVRPAARHDRDRRRRRHRPARCRRPTAAPSSTSASTRPATCSPTSPATTRSRSARPSSSAPRRRAHRRPAEQQLRGPAGHHHRRRQHRRRAADDPRRPPAGRQDRSAGSRARRDARQHRRVQAMYSYPSYDPNLVVDPDFEPRQATCSRSQRRPAIRCSPTPTRSATCRARRSRCSRPASPSRPARSTSTRSSRTRRVGAAADQRPDRELQRQLCGGDLTEVFARSCNIPFAQTAVDVGVGRRWSTAPTAGASASRSRSTSPAAASTFGNIDDLGPATAAAGDPRLRPERGPDGAAAHGDGRLHRRQRRTDDEAVRRRRPRPTHGHVLDSTEPEVWKTPISPETAATLNALMIGVAEHGTASCCIALDNGIPVAAKTGTAQLNGRPAGALARLDHRLRPGRRTRSTRSP